MRSQRGVDRLLRLATVQAELDPAVFAEAFAAGQQMTLEDAFATFLMPASSAV